MTQKQLFEKCKEKTKFARDQALKVKNMSNAFKTHVKNTRWRFGKCELRDGMDKLEESIENMLEPMEKNVEQLEQAYKNCKEGKEDMDNILSSIQPGDEDAVPLLEESFKADLQNAAANDGSGLNSSKKSVARIHTKTTAYSIT